MDVNVMVAHTYTLIKGKGQDDGQDMQWIQHRLASMMADASEEVRAMALEGLSKLVLVKGSGVIRELEATGVSPAQLRQLGDNTIPDSSHPIAIPSSTNTTSQHTGATTSGK